jgi:hypothetical protein
MCEPTQRAAIRGNVRISSVNTSSAGTPVSRLPAGGRARYCADMPKATNEEVVRRYGTASAEFDIPTLHELRHADWEVVWPQSGEHIHSSEGWAEIARNYPGGTPTTELTRVVGAEDRWVVSPGNTVMRVIGSGDFWWAEWRMTYPDGSTWICVDLMELREGKVYREVVYWAVPFAAPTWRAPWVESDAAHTGEAGV